MTSDMTSSRRTSSRSPLREAMRAPLPLVPDLGGHASQPLGLVGSHDGEQRCPSGRPVIPPSRPSAPGLAVVPGLSRVAPHLAVRRPCPKSFLPSGGPGRLAWEGTAGSTAGEVLRLSVIPAPRAPSCRRPPRSRRAALPHRALASGRDAQALRGIRMQHVGCRKPLGGEWVPPLPGQALALTAPS